MILTVTRAEMVDQAYVWVSHWDFPPTPPYPNEIGLKRRDAVEAILGRGFSPGESVTLSNWPWERL